LPRPSDRLTLHFDNRHTNPRTIPRRSRTYHTIPKHSAIVVRPDAFCRLNSHHSSQEIVENVKAKTQQRIIKGKVSFYSILYSNGFRSFDSIVHLGYQKHFRIYHQANYAIGDVHIKGIKGF
jgi:hypothetical protein